MAVINTSITGMFSLVILLPAYPAPLGHPVTQVSYGPTWGVRCTAWLGDVVHVVTSSSSLWVSSSIRRMSSMFSPIHLSIQQNSWRWKLVKMRFSCCERVGKNDQIFCWWKCLLFLTIMINKWMNTCLTLFFDTTKIKLTLAGFCTLYNDTHLHCCVMKALAQLFFLLTCKLLHYFNKIIYFHFWLHNVYVAWLWLLSFNSIS